MGRLGEAVEALRFGVQPPWQPAGAAHVIGTALDHVPAAQGQAVQGLGVNPADKGGGGAQGQAVLGLGVKGWGGGWGG